MHIVIEIQKVKRVKKNNFEKIVCKLEWYIEKLNNYEKVFFLNKN